jgi:HEAT repeat protein
VLEDRASEHDDVGAEAALILLEYNRLNPLEAILEHARSGSGPWRAVAARAAVAPKHALLRRTFLEDPDERVRRAALHAALQARDPGDLEALLEAARLDPDPLSRSVATRAVGAIGSQQAVLRLKDRWARADETVRQEIIEAWAMPGAFAEGGERELVRIAETETGGVAIAAAHALYRNSASFRRLGAQVLARAIENGTRAERRLAIQLASFADDDLGKAVVKAEKDSDVFVRVMALAKLLGSPEHKARARGELQSLAQKTGTEAIQARAALAAAGDITVKAKLNEQLASKSAEKRKAAARGLLRLGQYPDVATALGDGNPDVRTSVACSILASRT